MMTARVTDLHYVAHAVPGLAAERKFYGETWGLTEVGEENGKVYFAAEGSSHPFVIRLRQDDEKKTGMSPISHDQMYVFLLEHMPGNPWFAPETHVEHLSELMAPFGGHIPAIRAALGPGSQTNYRPLEWLLLPDPWYKGRAILIGDSAHGVGRWPGRRRRARACRGTGPGRRCRRHLARLHESPL